MSANADPDPYATIGRLRQAIATLRETTDEMERQHPNDAIADAQNAGARMVIDIIEATLNNNLQRLAGQRGVPSSGSED